MCSQWVFFVCILKDDGSCSESDDDTASETSLDEPLPTAATAATAATEPPTSSAAAAAGSSPPSKRRRLDSNQVDGSSSSSSNAGAVGGWTYTDDGDDNDGGGPNGDDAAHGIDGVSIDDLDSHDRPAVDTAAAPTVPAVLPDAQLASLVNEQLGAVASQLSRIGIGDLSIVPGVSEWHLELTRLQTRAEDWRAGKLDHVYFMSLLKDVNSRLDSYVKESLNVSWSPSTPLPLPLNK